jgi:hypothetical protein
MMLPVSVIDFAIMSYPMMLHVEEMSFEQLLSNIVLPDHLIESGFQHFKINGFLKSSLVTKKSGKLPVKVNQIISLV